MKNQAGDQCPNTAKSRHARRNNNGVVGIHKGQTQCTTSDWKSGQNHYDSARPYKVKRPLVGKGKAERNNQNFFNAHKGEKALKSNLWSMDQGWCEEKALRKGLRLELIIALKKIICHTPILYGRSNRIKSRWTSEKTTFESDVPK